MKRLTYTFEGYDPGGLKGRIQNHIQGMAFAFGGAKTFFSRNGHLEGEQGQILVCHDTEYQQHLDLGFSHVGGIDTFGRFLAVPLYNKDSFFDSVIRIYDHRMGFKLVGEIEAGRRVYAAGIMKWEKVPEDLDRRYLIGAVTQPTGDEMRFWTFSPGENGHVDRPKCSFLKDVGFGEDGARNNLVMDNGFLYLSRAHLGKGTLTKYDMMPISGGQNDLKIKKIGVYSHRYTYCSARFGATVKYNTGTNLMDLDLRKIKKNEPMLWYRTSRNIFRNKLKVRVDPVNWKEV